MLIIDLVHVLHHNRERKLTFRSVDTSSHGVHQQLSYLRVMTDSPCDTVIYAVLLLD